MDKQLWNKIFRGNSLVTEDKGFKKIKKELIKQTMEYEEEYGKVKIQKLEKINDPKKFITAYKRLTGATEWDLPDELLQYI